MQIVNFITDSSMYDEIIRRKWPNDFNEAAENLNDADWEILNESNQQDALNRHWFKQNYVIQSRVLNAMVTYH